MDVLVDSSVWIDSLRGTATSEAAMLRQYILDEDRSDTSILVGDLILLEVLRGITQEGAFRATRSRLLSFAQVELGGTGNAEAAVDHYRALRRLGMTIRKSVDCLIASWCIAHDVALLTSDRDFLPFARHRGLTLIGTQP
jgi:predicted nucleic acid-binding protein